MLTVLKNWLTETDNATFCIVRALGTCAGVIMLYKFVDSATADYQSFAVGIAAIMAAIALKNSTESK